MPDRITRPMVDARCQTINRMLGITDPAWNTPGTIQIAGAYGGTKVERVTSREGSSTDLTHGYSPLRETYMFLQGMIAAIESIPEGHGKFF